MRPSGLEPHAMASGALLCFPGIVLVIVKEASDLLFQLRCLTRLAHGSGVVEKLPLHASRQIVPLRDHCGPKALQDMLLILCERWLLDAIAW